MTTNKDVETQAKESPDAKDDVCKDVANKKGVQFFIGKKEGVFWSLLFGCFCLIWH